MDHLKVLRERLCAIEDHVEIPTQRDPFIVAPVYGGKSLIGVEVDNLGDKRFISFEVFVAVLSLLKLSPDHRAEKGNAMNYRLGDEKLKLNSVEGHVASMIYGTKERQTVFRRITPISRILAWAGVCENGLGYLQLVG